MPGSSSFCDEGVFLRNKGAGDNYSPIFTRPFLPANKNDSTDQPCRHELILSSTLSLQLKNQWPASAKEWGTPRVV